MSHYSDFYEARAENDLLRAHGPSEDWDWEAWANERSLRLLWARAQKAESELHTIKASLRVISAVIK